MVFQSMDSLPLGNQIKLALNNYNPDVDFPMASLRSSHLACVVASTDCAVRSLSWISSISSKKVSIKSLYRSAFFFVGREQELIRGYYGKNEIFVAYG